MEEIETLRKQNTELREALNYAIGIIKLWHGMDEPKDMREGSWAIYLKHSPEMKRLNNALATKD